MLPVLKIECVTREHASVQVAQDLILHLLALHRAHDSSGEVHDVAKDGEFLSRA